MADPTPPTPPSTPLPSSSSDPAKITESYQKMTATAQEAGKEVIEFASKFNTAMDKISAKLTTAASEHAFFRLSILGVNEAFDNLKPEKVTTGFTSLTDQFINLNKELTRIGASEAIFILKDVLPTSAKEGAKAVEEASRRAGDSLETTQKKVASYGEKMLKFADQHSFLKEQILQTAYQFGNFGTVAAAAGQNMESIDTYTTRVLNTLLETKDELGLYPEEMISIYKNVSKIPGAISMTLDDTFKGDKVKDFTSALVQFSRGARIPIDTLTTLMSDAREKFNLDTTSPKAMAGEGGRKVLEMFSLLSESSKKLGINYETFKTTVTQTSEAFKSYGFAASDVTKIIYDLAKGYDKVGLSAANASTLAGKFASNLTELSAGQKAFIMQLTGGPGGMLGAAEFDKLLIEKPKEAMDRMRQALKSQMGEIISTRDVTTQEDAARQMLQVRQLQAFGFKGSDIEAKRMLDLMKEGETMGPGSDLGDAADSLKKAMEEGDKVKSEQDTPMKAMSAQLDKLRGSGETISALLTKVFSGNSLRVTDVSEYPAFLQNMMKSDVGRELREANEARSMAAGTRAGQATQSLRSSETLPTKIPSEPLNVGQLFKAYETMGTQLITSVTSSLVKSDMSEALAKKMRESPEFTRYAASELVRNKNIKSEDIMKQWDEMKKREPPTPALQAPPPITEPKKPTTTTEITADQRTGLNETAGGKNAGAVLCSGCTDIIRDMKRFIDVERTRQLGGNDGVTA